MTRVRIPIPSSGEAGARWSRSSFCLAAALPLGASVSGPSRPRPAVRSFSLGTWELREDIQGQPVCGVAGYAKQLFRRQDCGFGRVTLSPAAAKPVKVEFIDRDGTVVDTQNVTSDATGVAEFDVIPGRHWDAGTITVRATVASPDTGSSTTTFTLNPLEVDLAPAKDVVKPGEKVDFSGTVNELDSFTCCVDNRTPVPATVKATLVDADGSSARERRSR